jgi:beta-galactosidase
MSRVAKWANDPANKSLFEALPVKGDLGILFLHETASYSYLSRDTAGGDWYPQALWGACRGFINNNLQADWVHPDDMNEYKVLYLPYPVAVTDQHANMLTEWVRRGGTLISEGCPGYFGGNLHVGEIQPNKGLDRLFGAVEKNVEFMPDIDTPFSLEGNESAFMGGGYKQEYQLEKGKAEAWYENGAVAAVSHHFGKGRTLLVGTHPSIHCHRVKGGINTGYFREMYKFTKREQLVWASNAAIQARLHRNDSRYYLWIVNPTREPQETRIKISGELGKLEFLASHWNEYHTEVGDNSFAVKVPARDVLILEFGT